ncbi:MAG: LexA binding domain [Pseudomonadota bacterium]
MEQGRTLTIVACLTLLHGKAPTLRQIASVLGCSRPAAHYRLHYLEKKGFWNAARWSLTAAGLSATRPLVDRAIAGLGTELSVCSSAAAGC